DLYLAGCIYAYPLSTTALDVPCLDKIERETGIEPVTFSLARRCSTTEPLPLVIIAIEGQPSSRKGSWDMGDERLELSRLAPTDPKSALSTSFSNRPCTYNRGTV